jgi:hypothetical protein
LLLDGKVLVAGGIDDGGNYLAAAELYDPGAGTFTATGSMTTARTAHTATLLPDGKVLIAGGLHFDVIGGYPNLASAELYDPSAGTFTATGSMTVVRAFHAATMLGSGKVLIAGGGFWFSAASAELYDPVARTFTATGSMIAARAFHAATLLPSGIVLVAGGDDPAGGMTLASAELYDPASGTFAATGRMTTARSAPTATLLLSGEVLITGGDALDSAELYQ